MRIKIDSKDKIESALSLAQGKAVERRCDPVDVEQLARSAESWLDGLGIPKNRRKGASAVYLEAGLPSAYKYATASTEIQITRGTRDWYLTDVERRRIFPGNTTKRHINLCETQTTWLLTNAHRLGG